MDIYLKKKGNSLVPVDKNSEEAFEVLQEEQWYKVKIKKVRDTKFHRKYWALLKHVVENSDYFTGKGKYIAKQELHNRLKLLVGWYTTSIITIEGVEYIMRDPKHTDFESMDNIEFTEYYESVIPAIIGDSELGISELEGF